jgi:hypothetical protein
LSRHVEGFSQISTKCQGKPGEWFWEASGVFFPEALEIRRDKALGIFESSERYWVSSERYLEIKHSNPRLR